MIDMRCAHAPAGVSAWGALVVRPAAGDAVLLGRPRHGVVRYATPFDVTGTATAAPTAPIQGTTLSATGVRVLDAPFGGTTVPTGPAGGTALHIQFSQNPSTTSGIHSPGSPTS